MDTDPWEVGRRMFEAMQNDENLVEEISYDMRDDEIELIADCFVAALAWIVGHLFDSGSKRDRVFESDIAIRQAIIGELKSWRE